MRGLVLAIIALFAIEGAMAQPSDRAAAMENCLAALRRLERTAMKDYAFAEACATADKALQSVHAHADGASLARTDQERLYGLARGRFDSLAAVPLAQRVSAIVKYALAVRSYLASDLIERAHARKRPVALLFSTSMSCACTLERCGNLEQLLNADRGASREVDCIVVDGYHRPDLQEQYKAAFLPTIVLVAPGGKEYKRFEDTSLTPAQWEAELRQFLAAPR